MQLPGESFYYVTTGLFGFGLIVLIVGIFNYFRGVIDKMLSRIEELKIDHVEIKHSLRENLKDTELNHERISRLERIKTDINTEEFADMLIMKIRAITPK